MIQEGAEHETLEPVEPALGPAASRAPRSTAREALQAGVRALLVFMVFVFHFLSCWRLAFGVQGLLGFSFCHLPRQTVLSKGVLGL